MLIPYGSTRPFLIRASDSVVPERMLAYSRTSSASWTPRVPRFTAYMSSLPTLSSQRANSSRPDLVGLGGVPGQVEPGRPLLARADRVLPAETGDEVAARVADGRDAELADEFDDVGAEAVGVGARVPGFVDAVVDAAAEVLDERAEEAAVTGPTVKWGSRVSWAEGMVVSRVVTG